MKRTQSGYYRKTFTFNGKRYEVKAQDKNEIDDKIKQKKEELTRKEQDLYNPTLNNYYKHFTSVRSAEVQEATIRTQKHQYELIAGVIMANDRPFGEMRIKDITRRDIEVSRQILLDAGKTPQNLNNCYAHLNHVFNSAVLDDTIIKNPCKALKQLKRKTALIGETKHRSLTVEETIRFFETAEQRNSYYINMFKLLIKTGMRIGEACALYKTDINKADGFIHITRTITRNEIGSYIVGDATKTKSGRRDIPLTSDVIQIVKDQEELNRMIHGFNWSGLLFKSCEGSILREYTLNREIKRICKQAEIEEFTCHAFRNTFATRFIEQRPQDYKILSELLGHKDVAITLNLYTHVMTENKVHAMNDILIKVS